ncbi:GNAT family N-acetyltransferase [Streptomyces sp. cg28]|uniref:GNAT family N-acetyltransferase n=1 Tax=Streptomyces sp. cg28 TaxID=3403457 RepID=UPI003B2213D4
MPDTRTRLAATWYERADQLTQQAQPASPFHTTAWSQAWDHVTTEPVLARRHLQLDDTTTQQHLSFSLVDDSPIWQAATAGTSTDTPWDGPVLYAPSLYGLYGGMPGASLPMRTAAAEHGLDLAARWNAAALVIGNLTPQEAARWREAFAPDAEVIPYFTSRAPAGGSLKAFAGQIPSSKVGREFLRQHRRGTDAGLRLATRSGTEVSTWAAEFTRHAQETAERHGPAMYGEDIVRGVAQVPGAVALVAEHDETGFAGGFLCFLHDGVLYLYAAAVRQESKRELNTYGWLMAEAVSYAAAHGAHTIDAGRGNYRYKHRLGFTHTPLTSLVYLPEPHHQLVERVHALDAELARTTHPTSPLAALTGKPGTHNGLNRVGPVHHGERV